MSVKNNWQTKKLGDVCDFYNGLWKGKEPPYVEVGVIRNTNITKNGELDDSDIAFLNVEKKQFEKRKLQYGDIILEKSGGGPKQPVGRVIIFDKKDGDFSFSNFTSALRVKDKNELDFKFLHKFLFFLYISGITEGMQSHSTGIRNLDLNVYKQIEIPVPSLIEQKKIVKILYDTFDQVVKAKENAKKNLQNSKELFESYLQSVFANPGKDWQIKKLGETCDILDNKRKPVTKRDRVSGKYPYYGATGVQDYVSDYIFNEKLILIGEDGAKWGAGENTAFAVEGKCWVNNHAHVIRPHRNKVLDNWIIYFLNVNDLSKHITGLTVQKLNQEKLRGIEIPLPPIGEQKILLKKLDILSTETKNLESIYQKKISYLEELKKSILQKAFSGTL